MQVLPSYSPLIIVVTFVAGLIDNRLINNHSYNHATYIYKHGGNSKYASVQVTLLSRHALHHHTITTMLLLTITPPP